MKLKIELDSAKLRNPQVFFRIFSIIFLAVAVVYFKIALVNIIIAFYFLISILFSLESRYSFYIGLLFLILTAFLQSMGNSMVAENYAIYAFYFLVIGTTDALIEALKKGK